jgi:peptidoglycan/LPS O-acetylase OafA/YrhL
MYFTVAQLVSVGALYLVAIAAAIVVGRWVPDGGTEPHASRLSHLDGVRGLAAIGVAACHINQHVAYFLGFHDEPLLGNHFGILGVQLFFALTAFLFTRRIVEGRFEPAAFLAGRVRRIVPMYLFAVAGTVVTGLLWSAQRGQPIGQTISEIAQILRFGFISTTMQPKLTFVGLNALELIGVAWTLSYEWIFYAVLVAASAIDRVRPIGLVLLAIAVLIAFGDYYGQTESVVWPFFLPGVVAGMLYSRVPRLIPAARVLIGLAAAVLIVPILGLPGFWTPVKLGLVALLFFAVLIARPGVLSLRPLQILGRLSYSIYLLQYLVIFNFNQITGRHPLLTESTAGRLATFAAMMAVTAGAAAVTYRLVELPWMRRSVPLATPSLGELPSRALP